MTISLVVAAAENDVIGREGGLPWNLSSDLKHFKRITKGHRVIMGRRTWVSIGRPLPKRINVVVTRDRSLSPVGCLVSHSLEEALAVAMAAGDREVFVIGGAELYVQAIGNADRIYLTRVEAKIDGDVRFPVLDEALWTCVETKPQQAGPRDDHAFRFEIWERKKARS